MQLVGQMPQIVVAKSALPEPTRIRCHDLAKTRKPSLPLLGERAGVRAGSLDTNIPFFGLAGRAGIKQTFQTSRLSLNSCHGRPRTRAPASPR